MRRIEIFALLAFACPLLISCGGGGTLPGPFVDVWGKADEGTMDGGPTVATFSNPANVATDANGNTFVTDYDSSEIRCIDSSGYVTTIVNQPNFNAPFGITVTADGKLYVETDSDDKGNKNGTTGTIWLVDPVAKTATVLISDTGGRPRGLCPLTNGKIALSDLTRNTILIFDPSTNKITPLAGQDGVAGFKNGIGTGALFSRPYGLAQQSDGSLLVADQTNNCIRRVTLSGAVTTFAGTGKAGSLNGSIGTATFNGPQGVAIAPNGTIYVADTLGHLVRRISGNQVFTEAGNGKAGFIDGIGTAAEFYGLEGLALTKNGSILWVSDGNEGDGSDHNRVRRMRVP